MIPYYEHGGITIYHGDCREVVPSLASFDLCLTDPPYGLGAARRNFGGPGVKRRMVFSGLTKGGPAVQKRDYGDAAWDDKPADPDTLELVLSAAETRIVWGGNYFDFPPTRCWLVWDKLRGDTDYADAELAWTNIDRAVRVFRYRWNGFLQEHMEDKEERYHPTQKPLPLMNWCLRLTPDAKTVLDPFMGSGTALVAAKQHGIQATGIEIEEKYCEIAVQRLAQGVLGF